MNRSLTLVPLAVFALAAPSLAQENKEAPPSPIAPEVKALLDRTAAAYRALNSYQSVVTLKLDGVERKSERTAKFLVQRPNRARFVVTGGTPKVTSVSNGVSIFRFLDGQPTYEKIPLLPGSRLGDVLEKVGGLSFPILGWLLSEPNATEKIVLPSFVAGAVGKPVTFDGAVADEIEFVIGGQLGGRAGTAKLAIDRADHLVRRITIEQLSPNGQVVATQVEEHHQVKVNPDLPKAAFGFAPPEGVTVLAPATAPKAPTLAVEAIPALPKGALTKTLAGGLKSTEIKLGAGAACPAGATVTVHYTGWLVNGTKFDSSVGGEPATFALSRVVKGWGQGIPGMKVGGKRRLEIPPALGYGAAGTPGGPIPPNATLIFDVELIAVQ